MRRRVTRSDSGASTGKRTPTKKLGEFPDFCDFDCRYAAFAPPDAVGACRKEQGVYCLTFKTYNMKNARCLGNR
jgi:hypothetical protein